MGFSPSEKHSTTSSTFSNIVDAATGSFTDGLTVSGTPVNIGAGVASQATAKAFLMFTTSGGTVTVERVFNVDSITDVAVGQFTVNWTAGALVTTDYSLSGLARGFGGLIAHPIEDSSFATRSTSECPVASVNQAGAVTDPQFFSIIAFE